MNRKLAGVLGGLTFLAMTGMANATIIWTASGEIGALATGSDNEELAGATITLTVEIDAATYGEVFGFFAFAEVARGEITISDSGLAANNTTIPLELYPGGADPIGYAPAFPSVFTSNGLPVAVTLASGDILTLSHSFFPPTDSGALAVAGDPVSIDDFPVGSPDFATFTVAIQDLVAVSAQYASTFATYEVTEVSAPIPEPGILALFGLGLLGLGVTRRRTFS